MTERVTLSRRGAGRRRCLRAGALALLTCASSCIGGPGDGVALALTADSADAGGITGAADAGAVAEAADAGAAEPPQGGGYWPALRLLRTAAATDRIGGAGCAPLLATLASGSPVHELTPRPVALEGTARAELEALFSFARRWGAPNASLSSIGVKPTRVQRVQLLQRVARRELPAAECLVPLELGHTRYVFDLVTDPRLHSWRSSEASENQELYDDEPDPLFRALFGAQGLSYGTHVKAGIEYVHREALPGIRATYGQLALHWWLVPQVELPPELGPLPAGVAVAAPPEVPECDVRLRIGSDPALRSSSAWLRADPSLCAGEPLIPVSADGPGPSSELSVRELLSAAPLLNDVGRLLDESGRLRPCDDSADFTDQSCSQQVVRALEGFVRGFASGQRELYVEIDVPGSGSHTFRLHEGSGLIERLSPSR